MNCLLPRTKGEKGETIQKCRCNSFSSGPKLYVKYFQRIEEGNGQDIFPAGRNRTKSNITLWLVLHYRCCYDCYDSDRHVFGPGRCDYRTHGWVRRSWRLPCPLRQRHRAKASGASPSDGCCYRSGWRTMEWPGSCSPAPGGNPVRISATASRQWSSHGPTMDWYGCTGHQPLACHSSSPAAVEATPKTPIDRDHPKNWFQLRSNGVRRRWSFVL